MEKIQELIKKFSVTKDRAVYSEIVDRLKTEDYLWAVMNDKTKTFFTGLDKNKVSAFIYTDASYFDAFGEQMKKEGFSLIVKETTAKDRLAFYTDLYRCGIERLIIDNGQTYLSMTLFDIINKPKNDLLANGQKVIMNMPVYAKASLLSQAMLVNKATPAMHESFFKDIFHTKFLVPVDREKSNLPEGDVKIPKDAKLVIPILMTNDQKRFYPIFTDDVEIRKYDKERKYTAIVLNFEQIRKLSQNGDGIVINPVAQNLILSKVAIEKVVEVSTNKNPAKNAEQEVKVLIIDPKNYPQAMADKLTDYFKGNKNIRSAYIREMIDLKQNSTYIIVVDFDGLKDAIFKEISEIATPLADGIPCEVIAMNTSNGINAVANAKPFYNKNKK